MLWSCVMFGLDLKLTHFQPDDLMIIFNNWQVIAQQDPEEYRTYGDCYTCPGNLAIS